MRALYLILMVAMVVVLLLLLLLATATRGMTLTPDAEDARLPRSRHPGGGGNVPRPARPT